MAAVCHSDRGRLELTPDFLFARSDRPVLARDQRVDRRHDEQRERGADDHAAAR